MEKEKFYITTTLPYVNADPHIGFAMEIIRADVLARYKRLQGYEVFFNTGTDEHGIKIYNNALAENVDPQAYVDRFAERFKSLKDLLNLSYNNFIRTTDKHHIEAAKAFWKACEENGDIYKKNYKVKYCIGCELEKTDSELVDGKCPIHPNQNLELIEEENYFFRFSKYQKRLLDLYEENPKFVVPDFRFNEIKKFVERGLEDFSISRLKSKMPWGVEVPTDKDHVMYVWFDALVNYISAIGWPKDMQNFNKWWPVTQYAGKDNLRQQSAMWQAMLLSAGRRSSKQIIINGFITSGGQKMSKSLGNVISPVDIVKEYGADALRYFLLREISSFEDGDFTMERFKEAYNANLANGLGNLTSRIMKMAETNLEKPVAVKNNGYRFMDYLKEKTDEFRFDLSLDYIWDKISELDREIQEKKPWESKDKDLISNLVMNLYKIGCMLEPFLPDVSQKIQNLTEENKSPVKPLFLRK